MLGFNPLASEAYADSGGPSVIMLSVSAVSISKLNGFSNISSVSELSTFPFRTSFRSTDMSSLSTVASEYIVVNMSNRDRSLTILVDEQNRSLLIPSSRP